MTEYQDQRDDDEFWRAVSPRLEPLRTRWFPVAALVALVASVPWYLPVEMASRAYGGLPLWVWMTLASSAVLSTVTSLAALRAWRDDDQPPVQGTAWSERDDG